MFSGYTQNINVRHEIPYISVYLCIYLYLYLSMMAMVRKCYSSSSVSKGKTTQLLILWIRFINMVVSGGEAFRINDEIIACFIDATGCSSLNISTIIPSWWGFNAVWYGLWALMHVLPSFKRAFAIATTYYYIRNWPSGRGHFMLKIGKTWIYLYTEKL